MTPGPGQILALVGLWDQCSHKQLFFSEGRVPIEIFISHMHRSSIVARNKIFFSWGRSSFDDYPMHHRWTVARKKNSVRIEFDCIFSNHRSTVDRNTFFLVRIECRMNFFSVLCIIVVLYPEIKNFFFDGGRVPIEPFLSLMHQSSTVARN